MIIVFVFADLCVAIGISIGFAFCYFLNGKEKEPHVQIIPEEIREKTLQIEITSEFVPMNKAREKMGIPKIPIKKER